MKYFLILFLFVSLLTTFSCRTGSDKTDISEFPDTSGLYRQRFTELFLDSASLSTFLNRHPEFAHHSNELFEFYRLRNFRFAWFNKEGMTEHAAHFMNMLKSSIEEVPVVQFRTLETLQPVFDLLHDPEIIYPYADSVSTEFEMMLSSSYFDYATRLYGGLEEQTVKSLAWYIPSKKIHYPELLDSILENRSSLMSDSIPVNDMYGELKKYLLKYSALLKNIEWDSIPYPLQELKKGDSDSLIQFVKKRLYFIDGYALSDSSSVFTAGCDSAVRAFQVRMGLEANGRINSELIDALNVSLESRMRTILLNMERCRWLPVRIPNKYISINLPEYRMHVFDSGVKQWSSNVIIGQENWNTVIFTGNLKYIVFSPYWNVPGKIFVQEMLPEIKKNPGYLEKHNLEIVTRKALAQRIEPASINWSLYPERKFPYIIRQTPGPHNALGGVKFLFPNSYNIYLHDTWDKSLFKKTRRTFSHGCIRVEEPVKLCEFLLNYDSSWTTDSIRSAMKSGNEKFIALNEEVPVIIVYFTSWVDAEGRLYFRDDIYGHDQRLSYILFETEIN